MRERLARFVRAIAEGLLRALLAWLSLWTLVFVLLGWLAPDPVTLVAGIHVDAATRAQLEREFDTNDGRWQAYVHTLGAALRMDLGRSRRNGRPVWDLIARPLGISVSIGISAGIASMLLGLAVFLALVQLGRRVGRHLVLAVIGFSAVPGFLVALLLSRSALLPLFGLPPYGLGDTFLGIPLGLVAPSACLILPISALGAARLAEAHADMITAPWYVYAISMGGSPGAVFRRLGWPQILRACLDVWANGTILGVTGAVAVEYVFGIPGLGTSIVDAIQLGDAPVILAIASVTGFLTLAVRFARDLIGDAIALA